MLLNKKCVYLGVTLFSAMILTSVSSQNVKADSTTDSNTNTSAVATTAKTGSTTQAAIATPASETTTNKVTTTAKSGTTASTVAATAPTSNGTTGTTVSKTVSAPVSGSSNSTSAVLPTASSTKTDSAVLPTASSTKTDSAVVPSTRSVATPVIDNSSTNPSNATSGSTVNSVASTGQTTTSQTSTSKTTSTGITISTQPANTAQAPQVSTNPTSGSTTTKPTTGTNSSTSYAIPSDVTDATVVNFTDPMIENMVKYQLNIKPDAPVTVGDIKGYINPIFQINETVYTLNHPAPGTTTPTTMSDQSDTPVESLNGLQYLQFLPAKSQVYFQAKLASDPNANEDLTPLDDVNLGHITIDGNFSDSRAKEIDVNQINDLPTKNLTYLELTGDTSISPNSGLNTQELAEIAPTIVKWATAPSGPRDPMLGNTNMFEIGNSSISDFTPLKGTEAGKNFTVVAATNFLPTTTPVYAVDNQPISFTAPKVLDINGNDLAANYHFTYNVAQADLADDNLVNKGNDNYEIMKPSQGTKNLTYGDLGWAYSTNKDAYVMETIGGTTFEAIDTNIQPIIWQANPTVTIKYENANGQPLQVNGQPMTKVLSGVNIGDSYDLTMESQVAGYNLTSPATLLKGNFTQDPQTVVLSYSPVQESTPVVPTTPTNVSRVSINVTPQADTAVQVYDGSGTAIAGRMTKLADITVRESAMINGKLYYMIGNNEWVLASDFDTYQPETGTVRTFGADTVLVNSSGQVINAKLSPNTEWKYNKIITINGKKYYEVATNEYLAVASGVKFMPTTTKTAVTVRSAAVVYNSLGQRVSSILPANSSWRTDGTAVINGMPMYRIANDEWIATQDANSYNKVDMVYAPNEDTPIYDINGNMLPLSDMLKAGTTWKVDQIVTIDGQKYYRVAPNEFVPDLAYNIGTSEGVVMPIKEPITVPAVTTIYNNAGVATTKTVPAGSSCVTTAEIMLHGVEMYQVAPGEWVRVSDVDAYNQTSSDTIHAVANMQLYNGKGQLLTTILQPDSDWKTAGVKTINGQKYLRVATDEYVKANA